MSYGFARRVVAVLCPSARLAALAYTQTKSGAPDVARKLP